jgi:23S rRNA (uracil1939-C5)-methyltransferase
MTGDVSMGEVEVTIEKLAFGGAGLGHAEGKVCFVPFTAVGDTALVRITKEKKSYMEGELLKCISPSALRIEPPCDVFGNCGGCCWQHLPYEIQVMAKQGIFAEILVRTGRVVSDVLQPMIPASSPYGYRSRVQFKVRSIGGAIHLGFYRQSSHFVIDLPGVCRIANDRVNLIYGALLPLLTDFPEPHRLPQIDVSTGDDGDALLLFHYIGERSEEVVSWLEKSIPGRVPVTGVFLQVGRKATMRKVWGKALVSYTIPSDLFPNLPEMTLSFRCGGFSQVNYRQNLVLIETVLAWADLRGTERVLDLYCGNGNFSLPLARFCADLVGIEDFAQSIEDAVTNARQNGISNARFRCMAAETGLRKLMESGEHFDVVVLDPPRTGALEAVRLIAEMSPVRILYVSCDPSTLARDLAELRKKGYEVAASRAIDMFPQTYHIESVTLLQKS